MDFFTFGDGAEVLGVAQPTLRGWCDKLEEMGLHYIIRNERNERILFDIDMKILNFVKDEKERMGRSANFQYLAIKIGQGYETRTTPPTHALLINAFNIEEHNVQKMINSEAFIATVSAIARDTATAIEESIAPKIKQEVRQEMRTQLSENERELKEVYDQIIKQSSDFIEQLEEEARIRSMPMWKRIKLGLFGEKDTKS